MQDDYTRTSRLMRSGLTAFGGYLRRCDLRASVDVNQFIANSHFIKQRIRRAYGRDAVVVHPPAEIDRFRHDQPRQDYFLVVAELVPYKRIDLAIEACNALNLPLKIIGSGPEAKSLHALAGPTVQFLGRCNDHEVAAAYEQALAFLMPGVEDFGITPVEAQAAGCPVVTFCRGGGTESVVDGVTGRYFAAQTVESLIEAIESLRAKVPSSRACRENAERFAPERFVEQMIGAVTAVMNSDDTQTARRRAA